MESEFRIRVTSDDRASGGLKNVGDAAEKSAKRTKKAFKSSTDSILDFNRKLLESSGLLTGLHAKIASLAAVAAVLTTIAVAGAKFGSQLKYVGGVMRATASEIQLVEDAARKMDERIEWGASKRVEAFEYLGLAGMTAKQSIAALPGVLDLATASKMDLAAAADIATDTLSAMGMRVSQLSELNDVLAGAATRSNTKIHQMAFALKYAAPIAAESGDKIQKLSAYIGILANNMIKGEQAGTGLRTMYLKVGEAAEKLGMGPGAKLVDVLREIKKQQIGVTEVSKLFGQEAATQAEPRSEP